MEKIKLTDLPYGYKDLEPYMSEEILRLHHDKHHLAYVNAANALINKLHEARKNPEGKELDFRAVSKSLSFNSGGAILHEIFWKTMAPASVSKASAEKAEKIMEAIKKEFGSIERFKTEFSETAKSVEGSGWAALILDKEKNILLTQIEKHNVNVVPETRILLCLDVWEHAYYLDYKNDRAKFIENWWNVVNWEEVEKRFAE